MPSPATRSGRLTKLNQQVEENEKNSKDASKQKAKPTPSVPTRTSARKSSGNKSPRSSEESNDLSSLKAGRSKRNANNDITESNSPKKVASETSNESESPLPVESKISTLDISIKMDKDLKKSDGDLKKSSNTPTSAVRRSSRAPVPSSKFKDMEMVLTPNAQKTKRSLSVSSPGDPVTEPSPKRSRRNSNKGVESLPVDIEKGAEALQDNKGIESPMPALRIVKDNVKSDSTSESPNLKPNEPTEKDVEDSTNCFQQEKIGTLDMKNESKECSDANVLKDSHEKKDVGNAGPSQSDDDHLKIGMEVKLDDMDATVKDQILELPTNGNVEDLVANSTTEEDTNEEKGKTDVENTHISSEISFCTDDATESIPQEVSVEEVGLSCQDGGLIVEETVHTFMDEKDVVIQSSDMASNLESSNETNNVSQTSSNMALSLDKDVATLSSNLMIKGQEVTVQERDGKMVAIVKIPGTLGNLQNTTSHTETGKQTEGPSSSLLPPNSKNVTLSTGPNQKSRHGYILNKKTEKQAFLTVSDQDQSTINISLEPTTISSILKPKPPESSTKSTSKTLYGRVIKQESGNAKPVVQNTPPSTSLIIKNAGSNQTISLLPPQSIKATNPKECKPYSLLSSPSELLQKLKGGPEKKQNALINEQPKKVSQLSSPSKKVVIITHPSKSGSQIDFDSISSSLLEEDGSSATIEPEILGSSDGLTTEDSIINTTDSVVNQGQDELSEVPTLKAVEEESDVSGEKGKTVDPSLIVGEDGSEQQEKPQSADEGKESTPKIIIKNESGLDIGEEDIIKSKEVIDGSGDCVENTSSDPPVVNETDKNVIEEIEGSLSSQTDAAVKEEIETESDVSKGNDASEELATAKEKVNEDVQSPKTQKIKLVDNGVVYELQIVSDGETRALQVQDGAIEFEGINGEVKQEIIDEDGTTSTDTLGKSTLGTQTVYSSKRGRPKSLSDKDDADAPVHKLATIVQEGGQKKHFYYVSVVPGKTMDGKYRRSVEHILPGCVVSDTGEYCCKECDYKTDKKANFYKHRRLHTGSKPHVCHVCKYQARTSSNLKRHMGIHEDIREFKCCQCALSFRQKIHLERHVRYRHEEKRVKCPMCDYVCANEQPDLKMHIKRKHTQESGKVVICPQCNIEVGSKRDLKQHLKFHKDGPELKLFCKECSFVTDCKSRLQRHLVVHSNVKPYHCGVCDYKATQKEHVVRHLRSQHKIEVNKPKRPWKKQVKQDSAESLVGNSRGDFTCGDKIFACNHCTMRFAKLINLYKHLHTQHSDIMPAETESNYYCVVCEFSTSSKKNLLIHMRRHNMTDQTPPTHVYSCVLCRYVNPRRRNLFQHMRKKHNIDISTQVDIAGMTEEEEAAARQDGDKITEFIQTEPGVYTQASTEEIATTSSFETVDGTSQVIKDNLAGVANMIKIEDLTRVAAGVDGKDSSTELVIDNGDGTQLIQAASLMQHKAADAIEGLQALAGQAGLIIDEEVSAIETKPTIVIEHADGGVINTTDGTLVDGSSIILSADQGIVEEQVATIEEASSEHIQHIVESVESADANAGLTSLELTEEQLSSLHHGDIVQMEGQVYMVELAQDPDSPDKQLLSFLPINQV